MKDLLRATVDIGAISTNVEGVDHDVVAEERTARKSCTNGRLQKARYVEHYLLERETMLI